MILITLPVPAVQFLPHQILLAVLQLLKPLEKIRQTLPGALQLIQCFHLFFRQCLKMRKQFLYHGYQVRRCQGLSPGICLTIGQKEEILRFCQIQIQIEPGLTEQFPGIRRKLNLFFLKSLSVRLREQSAPVGILGNTSLVHSQKKQGPDLTEPGSLHVPHQNLVCGGRNHADSRLRQSRLKKLLVFPGTHFFLSQDLHHLVQKINHDPIDLRVLSLHCFLSLGGEFHLLYLQLPLHLIFYRKSIQSFTALPHSLAPAPESFDHRSKFFQKNFPGLIQIHNFLLVQSPVKAHPFFLPVDIPLDSQGCHIVVHLINLGKCQ